MPSVWIVFDDETNLHIYGVFDNSEDAATYAKEMEHFAPNGMKYAEYSVPWKMTDRSTTIQF